MSHLEPGLEILPGLVLLRPLGRGGMGEAWLARDAERGEEVVAKVVPPGAPPERVALLRREARLVRKLAHPRIVPVYGFRSGERGSALTLRHMPGGDAGKKRGSPPIEVVRLARDVAEALEYLHGLGVVHRDVKPPTCCSTGRDARTSRTSASRRWPGTTRRGSSCGAAARDPASAPSSSRARPPSRRTISMLSVRSSSSCSRGAPPSRARRATRRSGRRRRRPWPLPFPCPTRCGRSSPACSRSRPRVARPRPRRRARRSRRLRPSAEGRLRSCPDRRPGCSRPPA